MKNSGECTDESPAVYSFLGGFNHRPVKKTKECKDLSMISCMFSLQQIPSGLTSNLGVSKMNILQRTCLLQDWHLPALKLWKGCVFPSVYVGKHVCMCIYIYIHICLYMYICISHSTYCTEGVGDLIPHEDKWWVCPSGFSAILCHCFPNMFRLHQSFSSAETISLGHLNLAWQGLLSLS